MTEDKQSKLRTAAVAAICSAVTAVMVYMSSCRLHSEGPLDIEIDNPITTPIPDPPSED